MCSTGSPEAIWTRSIRSRRSQPECVVGCVETITSLGRCSPIASIVARNGSASPTAPLASMPSSASSDTARSMRTWPASRTASS